MLELDARVTNKSAAPPEPRALIPSDHDLFTILKLYRGQDLLGRKQFECPLLGVKRTSRSSSCHYPSIHPPIFLVMFSVRVVKARCADPRTAQTNRSATDITASNAVSSGVSRISSIEFQRAAMAKSCACGSTCVQSDYKYFRTTGGTVGNQHRSYNATLIS